MDFLKQPIKKRIAEIFASAIRITPVTFALSYK